MGGCDSGLEPKKTAQVLPRRRNALEIGRVKKEDGNVGFVVVVIVLRLLKGNSAVAQPEQTPKLLENRGT